MFDVTPDDIKKLNDIDLRELIGRLCEAELSIRGLSPVAVTWGGDQNSPDGGLDVRVSLPFDAEISGFIPRGATGFQVKKPDMPREQILAEMRPRGVLRQVIRELADSSGAYVIVSANSSTADRALRNRKLALREALRDIANESHLYTDFYDSTRIATWVRCHAGLIAWVRSRVGRALPGWQPYGAWCVKSEGVESEYLLDDKLRLRLGNQRESEKESIAEAIDEVRDSLAKPGAIVRLVGLSGVGKTRLVQALFDSRIGQRSLRPSLAVYTNLSDNPDPQPIGLATDLIAKRIHAVLIVDNCPPDLHRRLSELCGGDGSTISVLTVEYDVREDQPEATQVITLDTSSPELIEKLVRRRYPHISQVDARTIGNASGGNARIAMALAETVTQSDTISGLSNDELFQRLFRQRQDADNRLLLAARACALVYSFNGVDLSGDEAEIPRLAQIAGQSPYEVFRHVGELYRRDLVQQRGPWRAVLPHAIANHLAARALEDTPLELLNKCFIEGGTARLAKSFSRRLSFLHDSPQAAAIVKSWLAPDGLLGDIANLNDLGQAMLANVAPVLPEETLTALERSFESESAPAVILREHLQLVRSLAYDPQLFERSAKLLIALSIAQTDENGAKQAIDTLASLFTIFLSGTHATVTQRIGVIESLLTSGEERKISIGLAALDQMLSTTHFSSSYLFDFGARSRDFGYEPRSQQDAVEWFGSALALIKRLADNQALRGPMSDLIVSNFRGLWTTTALYDELEDLCWIFADGRFWRDGWAACRQTMSFDKEGMTQQGIARLSVLTAELSPVNIVERIKAVVLGSRHGGFDIDVVEDGEDLMLATRRLDETAVELGRAALADPSTFDAVLPEVLRGGQRVWPFGQGLAADTEIAGATWTRLVCGLEAATPDERNVQVFRGFLNGLWDSDRELAQRLLDDACVHESLRLFLPALHSAVSLDDRGVERLSRTLREGGIPVGMFWNLSVGGTCAYTTPERLADLILLIASQDDGYFVAVNILYMRFHSDQSPTQKHHPSLVAAGLRLLSLLSFSNSNQRREDYLLAGIAKACLSGPSGAEVAAEMARKLRAAIAARETFSFYNDDLIEALLAAQPQAVLDAVFPNGESPKAGFEIFEQRSEHRRALANAIPTPALLTWCEIDPERRFPLAASFVTFSVGTAWSEVAKALLSRCPNPQPVLSAFIGRFRPMSWSGSRAALIEANAALLDQIDPNVRSALGAFVDDAKRTLVVEAARQRAWETRRDMEQDERFE